MEELTIGDKTYISSKRAAEITGYAKDYIGQLCREGRVTATLVGRSWYVLESAIREHRFGTSVAKIGGSEEKPSDPSTAATWSAPRYTSEEVTYIPPRTPEGAIVRTGVDRLAEKEPEILLSVEAEGKHASIDTEVAQAEADPKVLIEMQSAWQDWFKARQEDTPKEGAREESGETYFDIAPAEAQYEPVEEEEAATAVELHIREEMRPEPILEAREVVEEIPVVLYERPVERSSYIPRAIFLAVAGIAIVIAVIGTGSLDFVSRQGGLQASTINFIAGVEQYKRTSR